MLTRPAQIAHVLARRAAPDRRALRHARHVPGHPGRGAGALALPAPGADPGPGRRIMVLVRAVEQSGTASVWRTTPSSARSIPTSPRSSSRSTTRPSRSATRPCGSSRSSGRSARPRRPRQGAGRAARRPTEKELAQAEGRRQGGPRAPQAGRQPRGDQRREAEAARRAGARLRVQGGPGDRRDVLARAQPHPVCRLRRLGHRRLAGRGAGRRVLPLQAARARRRRRRSPRTATGQPTGSSEMLTGSPSDGPRCDVQPSIAEDDSDRESGILNMESGPSPRDVSHRVVGRRCGTAHAAGCSPARPAPAAGEDAGTDRRRAPRSRRTSTSPSPSPSRASKAMRVLPQQQLALGDQPGLGCCDGGLAFSGFSARLRNLARRHRAASGSSPSAST